jgi:hypothetical protein
MSSIILYVAVLNYFSLIFSVKPFFIEQCHYFAKWLSRTDGGAHSFARSYCSAIYDFTKSFFIATLLSHFSLLITQSFFIAVVLSHFAIVLRHF